MFDEVTHRVGVARFGVVVGRPSTTRGEDGERREREQATDDPAGAPTREGGGADVHRYAGGEHVANLGTWTMAHRRRG